MNFLIIDDERDFLKRIQEKVKREFVNSSCDVFLGVPPQYDLKDNYDVIIVDLVLGGLNGIDVAKRLKLKYPKAQIVCISNSQELIFDTQILGSLCFIRKHEFDYDFNVMKQLINKYKGINKEITLRLDNINHAESRKKIVKINTEDIVYVSSYAHKVTVITIKDNYTTNLTLKSIGGMLRDCGCFAQIHRGHIVNMNYIRLVGEESVELIKVRHNANILEIGRKYKNSFNIEFERFLLV